LILDNEMTRSLGNLFAHEIDDIHEQLCKDYKLSAQQINAVPEFIGARKAVMDIIPVLFNRLGDDIMSEEDSKWYRSYAAHKTEEEKEKLLVLLPQKYLRLPRRKLDTMLALGVCGDLDMGYRELLGTFQNKGTNDYYANHYLEWNHHRCMVAFRTICEELVKSRNQETGLGVLAGLLREHMRIPPDSQPPQPST
jgi:hypothetical protein